MVWIHQRYLIHGEKWEGACLYSIDTPILDMLSCYRSIIVSIKDDRSVNPIVGQPKLRRAIRGFVVVKRKGSAT